MSARKPLAVVITGARTFADRTIVACAERGASLVIHGGARGADALAEACAKEWFIPTEVYRADWSRGPGAGPRRNQKMIDRAVALRTDGWYVVVYAFPLPGSIGTWDCVRRAKAAGLHVVVEKPRP